MSLRINTNVAALNSYNNLSANQSKLEGAFQQLSSGLRINKAADDAAGLSISQGLTAQINGLTQAVSNANDGINVAQIADGALGTSQDILQRMRVLVNKAANIGTQDSRSWGAIQNEVKNLNTQLDNIAGQTKFGQTKLLDGSYNYNFQVGADSGDIIALNLKDANVSSKAMVINGTEVNLNTKLNIAAKGGSAEPASGFDMAAVLDGGTSVTLDPGTTALVSGSAQDIAYDKLTSEKFFDLTANTQLKIAGNTDGGWDVSVTDGTVDNKIGTITRGEDGLYTVMNQDNEVLGKIDGVTYDHTLSANDFKGDVVGSKVDPTSTLGKALQAAIGAPATNNSWYINEAGVVKEALTATPGTIDFTTGTTFNVNFNETSGIASISTSAGVERGTININEGASSPGVSYETKDANADLDMILGAIDSISNFRSQIGAVQNQLSYTVTNLGTAITNVTASRSNLTDADLAEQVTAMTQSQILTQAATSVLAQANSAPQAILRLLQ